MPLGKVLRIRPRLNEDQVHLRLQRYASLLRKEPVRRENTLACFYIEHACTPNSGDRARPARSLTMETERATKQATDRECSHAAHESPLEFETAPMFIPNCSRCSITANNQAHASRAVSRENRRLWPARLETDPDDRRDKSSPAQCAGEPDSDNSLLRRIIGQASGRRPSVVLLNFLELDVLVPHAPPGSILEGREFNNGLQSQDFFGRRTRRSGRGSGAIPASAVRQASEHTFYSDRRPSL